MINKQVGKIILLLGIIQSIYSASILQGLTLEEPVIRRDIVEYVAERGAQPCKLVIGAGHIQDIETLHPNYQHDGNNSLTESLQGGYEFHEHKGWYTFSAETDDAFGSDVIGNIQKKSHQTAIFFPNVWDLIWDESYHPNVLSAPNFFEKVFSSLKSGGVFVFTLPIHKKSGCIVTGHTCSKIIENPRFNETLAYQNLSNHFDSIEVVEAFARSNLQAIGFSEVNMHKSAILKAGKCDFIEDLMEEDLSQILSLSAPIAAKLETNPLLAIDDIFQHTGGMYYIVARK